MRNPPSSPLTAFAEDAEELRRILAPAMGAPAALWTRPLHANCEAASCAKPKPQERNTTEISRPKVSRNSFGSRTERQLERRFADTVSIPIKPSEEVDRNNYKPEMNLVPHY